MQITKSLIDTINKYITDLPPETGGILGSHDGLLIDEVVMDLPEHTNIKPCSYSPNVDFLNQNIDLWQKRKIFFMGIFHTHFVGVKTLSCGDKKYIHTIMKALQNDINALYFPIFVLPNRELVCYKAEIHGDSIEIYCEELIIKS